jgi:hypothetical protein
MSDNPETRRPRLKNALLWIGLVALALFPYPWWF